MFECEEDDMKNRLLLLMVFMLTACSTVVSPPPTPTLISTNTAAPTSTATPSPTLTPTPVPDGPCDNPLVPLGVGNQWNYRATTAGGEFPYTLKSLERQDNGNVIVMVEFTDQKNNKTIQEAVICRDGAIENYPLFVMDMLFADYLNGLFNTYHDKGDYAPAYISFVEKDWIMDWQTEYLTEDSVGIKDPLGGSSLYVLESSPIDLSFQMDGSREPVSVPAGDFPQAIKVLHSFTLSVTLLQSSGNFGGLLTLNTTQWYEPYVGLVRAQLDSASLSIGLQKLNIPMQSTVELVEFIAGK
jgi:hypothetical protein